MGKIDPYAELGLEPGADKETIKRAYRKRAKKAHPDAGGDKEAFQRLALAHEILSDDDRRARYDQTGDTGEDGGTKKDLNLLTQLVLSCANDMQSPEFEDLVEIVRGQIMTISDNLMSKGVEAADKSQKLSAIAKRLRRKGNGENFLSVLIEQQASWAKETAERHRAEVERADRMLKLLEDFTYETSLMQFAPNGPSPFQSSIFKAMVSPSDYFRNG